MQLNKLKSAAKNKTGTALRLPKKNFENEELPHELFLTTKQTTKIRSAFANNISTDIELSNIEIPLARDNLPGSLSNLTSNAINKFERKISGKVVVRAGKRFILFIFERRYGLFY